MILREKVITITLFLLANGQFCSKLLNFPEIVDDHNSGTKERHEICVKMCSFGYSTVFHQ